MNGFFSEYVNQNIWKQESKEKQCQAERERQLAEFKKSRLTRAEKKAARQIKTEKIGKEGLGWN